MEYNNYANVLLNELQVKQNTDMINLSDITSETNINDKNLRKRVKQYFCSNYNGTCINNAETGELYTDLVGSKNEKQYFRVIDATGNVNEKGHLAVGVKTPNKLLYKNAEQYIYYRNKNYNKNNTVNSSI